MAGGGGGGGGGWGGDNKVANLCPSVVNSLRYRKSDYCIDFRERCCRLAAIFAVFIYLMWRGEQAKFKICLKHRADLRQSVYNLNTRTTF